MRAGKTSIVARKTLESKGVSAWVKGTLRYLISQVDPTEFYNDIKILNVAATSHVRDHLIRKKWLESRRVKKPR